ncbi:MAG: hypothetical protein JW880_04720 [Candidatus Thermoplasmatota archaeon]|nr:hypothetical protein [Candidatus Thermoplasmatota archaeon]
MRLAAAIAVLAYASLLDLRTRKVGNRYWISLSMLGIGMLALQTHADDMPLEYLAVLLPIVLILADVFIDSKLPEKTARALAVAEYASAILILIFLSLEYGSDEYFQHFIAVPAMMLLVVLLYMLDALRGGADAKALIALAILFPFYPYIGSFPMLRPEVSGSEVFMPFTFAVLITAAIVVAVMPIWFLAKNVGDAGLRFPQALLGYRMDTEKARGKHVWLMERMVNGRHLLYSRPKADEDLARELSLLEEAGHRRVWVTPKVPFIVPLLLGLVVCATLGNPLLLLFPL